MKHSTYTQLYQAHLGAVDERKILQIKHQETDLFYHDLIDRFLGKTLLPVPFDNKIFTTDFLTGDPRQRLDETYFAFILRIVAIIKEENYARMFRKPESHHITVAWLSVLRSLIFSSLALLYNVQWTPETIFKYLEPTIVKIINGGDAFTLRQLMIQVGISNLQDEPYIGEKYFNNLSHLTVDKFGSFYWRFLHWMAEADAMRDMELYKIEWRQILLGPLYRTLRCGICLKHFKNNLDERSTEILEGKDLPRVMFEIHNKVHDFRRKMYTFLQEPDYTESQYEADAVFMRQALSP